MSKVLIIGGGLAGLSSAIHLTRKKIPVLLLESSNRLGGRVSSFHDNLFGEVIDNGQHIMMGCYNHTLGYLDIINARDNFYFQKNLEVVFYNSGKKYPLKADIGPYPLNLLKAIMSFRILSFRDRRKLAKFFIHLPLSSTRDIQNYSALQWLKESGQSEELINIFWNTFIIGAMNAAAENTSALMLRDVLLRVFLSGRRSPAIIIPDKPLTEAFCTPAVDYLLKENSEVSCGERVLSLDADKRKNRINSVTTNKRVIKDFTHVISAVPLYMLKKIFPFDLAGEFKPQYSPILTIHFKTDRQLFPERFAAVTESPLHWVFRHQSHYTIVISSANELTVLDNKDIEKNCY
jgi:hydroxysqualene dehydroxylase